MCMFVKSSIWLPEINKTCTYICTHLTAFLQATPNDNASFLHNYSLYHYVTNLDNKKTSLYIYKHVHEQIVVFNNANYDIHCV